MGVRMLPGWDQQQAWLSPPSPQAAEALLGRGGCGRAGIVFLCHRKQLPEVSQAGSGLPVSLGQPELLSQPAGGRGSCAQMLCRNGSVTWNISELEAGFEASPCPTPSTCRGPAACCSPEPGFAGGSLRLHFGRWQQGARGRVIPKHPRVCTEGAL